MRSAWRPTTPFLTPVAFSGRLEAVAATATTMKVGAAKSPVMGQSGPPPPYPTKGGHVPLYSVVHGRIQKRMWVFRNPSWCELCKEPVGQWVNHMGRKDHALMDQHYTALVEWPRRWDPEILLTSVFDELGVAMESYQQRFGRLESDRRNELYAMLVALEGAGMLYFGEPRHTFLHRMQGGLRGMDQQGALVLHQHMIGPFLRLYPEAHIQDYSNLLDFISCAYNMETVYDLCGLYTLDRVAIKENYRPSSPVAVGLGGSAASSSANSGYDNRTLVASSEAGTDSSQSESRIKNSQLERARKQQEELDEDAFSRKAVFVRQILGQLRWLTLPGQQHPAGCEFPPHILTIGDICIKSLIAEIISARLCEYMVRAEPVWRSCGLERTIIDMPKVVKSAVDVLPAPVKYSYRPMSRRMDDYYSTSPGQLEKEVLELLRKKGLQPPQKG